MKLFLDTSYLLSYFRISIEQLPYDFLKHLMQKEEIELFISEISFTELVAKCFKLSLISNNPQIDDIISGLDALRNDKNISIITWYEHPKIFEIAYELRKIHSDFFDCIIYASAILEADALGTFDDTFFKEIKNNKDIVKLFQEINPGFQFWFSDFKGKPKSL